MRPFTLWLPRRAAIYPRGEMYGGRFARWSIMSHTLGEVAQFEHCGEVAGYLTFIDNQRRATGRTYVFWVDCRRGR